jgi:hypothetical protein
LRQKGWIVVSDNQYKGKKSYSWMSIQDFGKLYYV